MTSDVKMVYCYGTNEEVFHADTGREVTREVAIAEAIDELGLKPGDALYLGTRVNLRGEEFTLDGDDLCEQMAERIYDSAGESADDWPNATKEQRQELTETVRKVVGEWLDKHGLQPWFYAVEDVERLTVIDERTAKAAA
jgi:hypothetical protein